MPAVYKNKQKSTKWERWFKMEFKLLQIFSCVAVMVVLLPVCAGRPGDSSSQAPVPPNSETEQVVGDSSLSGTNDNSATEENRVEKMTLQIGNNSFTATLESNDAVEALVDMMREAPIAIQMSDYSGFEKVGSLGTSKLKKAALILSSGSDDVYDGAIYEYQNSFLDYLKLENMGIFTAFDKQNKSEEKLKELREFGRNLVGGILE